MTTFIQDLAGANQKQLRAAAASFGLTQFVGKTNEELRMFILQQLTVQEERQTPVPAPAEPEQDDEALVDEKADSQSPQPIETAVVEEGVDYAALRERAKAFLLAGDSVSETARKIGKRPQYVWPIAHSLGLTGTRETGKLTRQDVLNKYPELPKKVKFDGHGGKSKLVRSLARNYKMSVLEISRYTGIRYQHVRQIVKLDPVNA